MGKTLFYIPKSIIIMIDQKELFAAIEDLDRSVDELDLILKVSTKIKAEIKESTQSRVNAMDKLTQELKLKLEKPPSSTLTSFILGVS